jgi:hypothetical protein
MAGAAGSLDHLLAEPFFCELPIIKGPAHGLKNIVENIQNNVSFGPEKLSSNTATVPSKVLLKVREYEELTKFKDSLTNEPEIVKTMAQLKTEFARDIFKEIDKEMLRIKKSGT